MFNISVARSKVLGITRLLASAFLSTALFASTLFTQTLFAQTMPSASFGGVDMQKMQEQAAKMEQCMAQVKEKDLKNLERKAKQLESEVKSLCAAGKRDEAQSRALELAQSINRDQTVLTIKECTKDLTGMMAQMMPKPPLPEKYDDLGQGHICD